MDSIPSPKGKKLRSSRSSISRSDSGSLADNRNYVERLMRRIVEHVAYREAVRSEPKIVECLELYQQDMWEIEHLKKSPPKTKSTQQQQSSKTKKKRSSNKSTQKAVKENGGGDNSKPSTKASSKAKTTNGKAASHSGMYDLGALMKEAKTLQQFETTGKKPKKSKKAKQQQQQRPDTVDGSVNFRERSQSVSHIDVDAGARGGGGGGARNGRMQRRMSVPSRNEYRAARYNKNSNVEADGSASQSYPFANPNIFSLAGCGSNQLLQRVLYLACQQNETIKFEKKVRKERERTSQMPVLASSLHIQLLCAKATAKDKTCSEKSWNSYF